jgi:AhpD family alkylhydroperoxidase
MESRINFAENGQGAMKALFGVGIYLAKSGLDKKLLSLVDMRVSQINGCAYCLDMHSKDLRVEGETEQRTYMLDAWRESPLYTDRERGALEWAEAVTNITEGHVPDEIYERVRKEFSEKELIDLTLAVTAVNSWNRVNIALRTPAGGYQPGMFASMAA